MINTISIIISCINILTVIIVLFIIYRENKLNIKFDKEKLNHDLALRIDENIILYKQNEILIDEVKRLTKENNVYESLLKSFKYKENTVITDEEFSNKSLEEILSSKEKNTNKFPEKFKYENINKRLYKPSKEDIEIDELPEGFDNFIKHYKGDKYK